jgi:hypothetical protein
VVLVVLVVLVVVVVGFQHGVVAVSPTVPPLWSGCEQVQPTQLVEQKSHDEPFQT